MLGIIIIHSSKYGKIAPYDKYDFDNIHEIITIFICTVVETLCLPPPQPGFSALISYTSDMCRHNQSNVLKALNSNISTEDIVRVRGFIPYTHKNHTRTGNQCHHHVLRSLILAHRYSSERQWSKYCPCCSLTH